MLGGVSFFYGLVGLDFSYDEVKRRDDVCL